MSTYSKLFIFKSLLTLSTLLLLTACGGGGSDSHNSGGSGGGSNPVIESISITPANALVKMDTDTQLSVIANYTNGTNAPITSGVTWVSDNPSIATVVDGTISGQQEGQTTIHATYSGFTQSATVTAGCSLYSYQCGMQLSNNQNNSGNVIISEVGSGKAGDGQWLEIYNGTGNEIELEDYQIKMMFDDVGSPEDTRIFALPTKTLLPGGYLVALTKDLLNIYDSTSPVYSGNSNVVVMNEAGGYWDQAGFIELIKNNVTVDFVRFGNSTIQPLTASDWGVGAAPSLITTNYGLSLSRDGQNSDTNTADDWELQQYPTMGGANDINCTDDNDEDGIPDCSEMPGSTYAGLPLYEWGARVNQKDLFVEIDYMDPGLKHAEGEKVDGMIPQREALDKIRDRFASKNIALHFDVGDLFDHEAGTDAGNYDLGGGNQIPFSSSITIGSGADTDMYHYKTENMAANRRSLFYYVVLAYSQTGSQGSSGVSEIGGNDTLITIGAWGLARDVADTIFSAEENTNVLINFQAATLMHEFGHALGLNHGGGSGDAENFEPNYLSTMNYLYQLQGLPTIGNNEGDRYYKENYSTNTNCFNGSLTSPYWGSYLNFKIDYSNGSGADLEEIVGATESQGLRRAGSTGVDYNCNGSSTDVLPNTNLNPHDSGSLTTLDDHNDWDNLEFFFATPPNKILNGDSRPDSHQHKISGLPLYRARTKLDRQPVFVEPEHIYQNISHIQNHTFIK